MDRAIASMRVEFRRGLHLLGAVPTSAALAGLLDNSLYLAGWFAGWSGDRHALAWATIGFLPGTLVPTAAGIAIAASAYLGHRYLVGRVEQLEFEMHCARRNLRAYLCVLR